MAAADPSIRRSAPLVVGFDVTATISGSTGVARYVRELTAALPAAGIDLRQFAIGRARAEPADPGTRYVRLPLRMVHRSWAMIGRPRAEWLAPGAELVHSPDLVPPPTRLPLVMTIHDLAAIQFPELHPPRAAALQRRQLDVARARASVVLCVSAATAAAVAGNGVDPERVVVAPLGLTALPTPHAVTGIDGDYLLAVGSLHPRKDLETLVAAFARARLDGVRLVLAGPAGWGSQRVFDAMERHQVVDRAVVLGPVSDAHLAALYRDCVAVCLPSIAEGFGFPALEALAAGTPLVASDLPVLREIADGVAVFVAPQSVDAWVNALERVVTSSDLRRHLRALGPDAAAPFTWERTARLTIMAYEQALN